MKRRHLLPELAGVTLLAATATAFAQSAPAGYPADYATLIANAKKEGKVVIYTSTDAKQAAPLVDAFKKAYGVTPGAYRQACRFV